MRQERRRTRESLTRALERIAASVALDPTRSVEWYDRRLNAREAAAVATKRIWVAGSYARGAEECGDLDIILEAEIEGAYPPIGAIGMALFGRVQDVSLFIGTPDRNSSNISFPEARLVWSSEEPDFHAHLGAISADPSAGRFLRATDAVPFRPEQLAAHLEELQHVLELKEKGALAWTFVPASEVTEDPDALKRSRFRGAGFGAKTADTVTLAISHLGETGRKRGWEMEWPERTTLRYDGTLIVLGKPRVPVESLESVYYDRVAVVPHSTRRGPNGIWLITRGPEHPIEKRYAQIQAFVATLHGEPIIIHEVTENHRSIVSIDLFRSADEANEYADDEREWLSDEEENELDTTVVSGSSLLGLIAGCDLIRIDGEPFALSPAALRAAAELWGDDAPTAISEPDALARAFEASS